MKLSKNPTREDLIRLSCDNYNAAQLLDEIVVVTLALEASRLATETAMETIRRQVERIQQLEIKLGGKL